VRELQEELAYAQQTARELGDFGFRALTELNRAKLELVGGSA
jgi:hypothetical protein